MAWYLKALAGLSRVCANFLGQACESWSTTVQPSFVGAIIVM